MNPKILIFMCIFILLKDYSFKGEKCIRCSRVEVWVKKKKKPTQVIRHISVNVLVIVSEVNVYHWLCTVLDTAGSLNNILIIRYKDRLLCYLRDHGSEAYDEGRKSNTGRINRYGEDRLLPLGNALSFSDHWGAAI